jgi:hypothetical protein
MLRILDACRGDPLPEPVRPAFEPSVVAEARSICEHVRVEGDAALVALTRKHDGADIKGRLVVTAAEKVNVNTLIPLLKAHGGTDILELPISKIVP